MADGPNTGVDGIVRLTQALVRTPSQAFVDPLEPVFEVLADWLNAARMDWEVLTGSTGRPVAALITLDSGRPGPVLCLNACVDTAPVGQLEGWEVPPWEGRLVQDRLYGRGVADSKVAVALLCHLARDLARVGGLERGILQVLLDGDEHTGGFEGVRAYLAEVARAPDFVMIGYPGNQVMRIGARGFYRVTLVTHGQEAHSGAKAWDPAENAIVKMARLLDHLMKEPLPVEPDRDFAFGPRLSVTAIKGGTGFSQIPGLCRARIDVRLTPACDERVARHLLQACVDRIDRGCPTARPTILEEVASWPWYKLDRASPTIQRLHACAEQVLGCPVGLEVAAPSNIGNFLAAQGIPATCGFGVTYGNQHAPNEWIALDSIRPVYDVYRGAIEALQSLEPEALRRSLLHEPALPPQG